MLLIAGRPVGRPPVGSPAGKRTYFAARPRWLQEGVRAICRARAPLRLIEVVCAQPGLACHAFRPTPYVSHQALFDPTAPHGLGYYWKSEYVPSLSDGLIDTLAEHAWRVPTPESYTIIFHLGGAIGREHPEASAFEDRRAAHAVNIDAVWSEPARASACIAWTRELWEAVRPYSTGRIYVNFLGEEGQDRVRRPTARRSTRGSRRSS